MRRKKKVIEPVDNLATIANGILGQILLPRIDQYISYSASTINYGTSVFNSKIDTYTIKQYDKDDFKNLIQLLTLWIDDKKITDKIKEIADTFDGEEFSEEDIDKFILALSFEIDDQTIRNKFEETHQYWKNIKR